jgi:hypothetical protein
MRVSTLARTLTLALPLAVACTSRDDADGAVAVTSASRAAVVAARDAGATPTPDSALAASLARFREGLPRTDTLRHALASKEAVVREFARLVAANDTMGLARLHLSRSEWAWLVWPESRYARAPYRQQPDVGWMLIIARSNSAVDRLLARRGGRALDVLSWRCADEPESEGRNHYWGRCTITYRNADGAVLTERLFSSIIERDGRYKIGSYSNQF